MFNKICFAAAFATRKKESVSNKNEKTNQGEAPAQPSYLRPSLAAAKRNEEKMVQRQADMDERAKKAEREFIREKNANAKKREVEAEKTFQSRLQTNLRKYEQQTANLSEAQRAAELSGFVSPIKEPGFRSAIHATNALAVKDILMTDEEGEPKLEATTEIKSLPMKQWSPIKRAKPIVLEASRADKWLDRQILATKISDYEPPEPVPDDMKPEIPVKVKRYGGGESFTYNSSTESIPKMAAKRCYRVLTYVDDKNGERQVMDVVDGNVYWCRTGPQKRRITPDAIAMDSKQAALSERFPLTQVGAATSGNGTLPRLLVAFDCWGKCMRRNGGVGAAKYEFVKYIRIEEFLNAPKTVSKKHCERPIEPNLFPKRDSSPLLSTRKAIDRSIYLDKTFNTKPWRSKDRRDCVCSKL